MTAKKVENYNAETTAHMIDIYQSADDSDEARQEAMEAIQEFTGKSLPSIRSKLATEGVYIAKAKPVAKGGERITKATLVNKMADAEPSKPSGFFDSIEGANKNVIQYVLGLQSEIATRNFEELDGDFVEPVKAES
jgi:hypothetical protein